MKAEDAVDVMCSVFRDAWSAAGQQLDRVRWDDKPGTVPDDEAPWARVTIRHTGGPTRAFGQGRALYSNIGTLFVQVFTPMGDANQQAYTLGQAVVTAFRNASNEGVSFRDTHLKEVGNSGAFEQINVLTNFSYDD